jgi:hypothetical protein
MFVFSILTNLYINFETGKLPAHERNNFIFHVNMHFCNIVLFHKCRYWVLATQCIILYKNCAIFSSSNAYLREIWNCFFHAQAIFQSQSLYLNWPKSKKQTNKQKQKTKVGIYTKTVNLKVIINVVNWRFTS